MPDFGGNVARMQEFSALLELGLSNVFMDDLPTHPKLYTGWLTEKSAKEFIEDELVASGLGAMPQKGIGQPFTADKPYISAPKDFELVTYGLAFVGEYELIRWDKYGVFTGITKKLTRSGVDRKNVLAYSIPNNAISASSSVYQTYSGENLISTAHSTLRGGTAKNAPTNAVDLTYLGMQEAISDYMQMVNEDGQFIVLDPAILMCHPSDKWVADTLLKSATRPDNANRAYNTLSASGLTVHCSPYLDDTDAWFVLADKSKREDAFVIGDDLTFRRAFDPSTWNNIFSMYASFRVAVLHWYGWWGSAGA